MEKPDAGTPRNRSPFTRPQLRNFGSHSFSLEPTTPLSLIAIRSNQLELNDRTLEIIKESFKNCESLSPFLVLGHPQSGKSTLLDAMMGGLHFKDLPDEIGLYIWPSPFRVRNKILLLMEMSGIIFESDTLIKLAATAEALSAVCGICLERTSFFENLDTLLELSGGTSAPCTKKFLVFSHCELPNSRSNSTYLECKKKYPRNCIFMEKSREHPSERLLESIRKEVADFAQESNMTIGQFASFAQLATHIANETSNILDIIGQFGRLEALHESQLMEPEGRCAMNAESLELFSYNSDFIDVNPETMKTLEGNFKLTGETVVIVVLGDPGVGKSTLLNCWIRHIMPSLPNIFLTDCPSKCRVLSCPLWVGHLQCMVIDLEGLGGVDTIREETLIWQERVVTGVLALANIPCFVVSNERSSIATVEKRVKLLCELKQYYLYEVEHILLLFHDKDVEAVPNAMWETAIHKLHSQYFQGREVFKVLNKPSFVSSNTQQQQLFLAMLYRECITQNDQAEAVTLCSKLENIKNIVHSLEPIDTLQLTSEEWQEYNSKAPGYINELGCLKGLEITHGRDLASAFQKFLKKLKRELAISRDSVAVTRKIWAELETRSSQQRGYVSRIDALHYQIEFMPFEEFLSRMKAFQKQAVMHALKYKWWTTKDDVVAGYTHFIARLSDYCGHRPATDTKRAITMLNTAARDRDAMKQMSVPSFIKLWTSASSLRAYPYTKVPENSVILLVVGGQERVLFCNELAEIIQPVTFPGFQTFTEGDQCFTCTYYPSTEPSTCCIISLELSRINLFQDSAELLSRVAFTYVLLDSPTRTYELSALDATEVMLDSYKALSAPPRQRKKVIFLSDSTETLTKCQLQLAMHSLEADCRRVKVEESSPSMTELLYEVPRLLRNFSFRLIRIFYDSFLVLKNSERNLACTCYRLFPLAVELSIEIPEVVLPFEELVGIMRRTLITMALPLITFTQADHYSAQLVEATASLLSSHFRSIPFYPVFVYGTTGKNSLLAALLSHSNREAEHCFDCEEEAADGVYVWPEPVTIGRVTLMLLKLRKPTDDSVESYMELRRKVTAGLMGLSSVCCMCEERSQICRGIAAFTQDYSLVREKMQLEISKLLVFMDDSWFKKPNEKAVLDRFIAGHVQLLHILRRGREGSNSWLPELSGLLGDFQFHEPFTRTHLGDSVYVSSFLYWTSVFVKMANLNLRVDTYLSKLPDTNDPEARQRVKTVFEAAARAEEIEANGESLQFVVEGSGEDLRYVLDPQVLERVGQSYRREEPTVVLVLLGAQGLGKSTLLDYIIQFCTEMPQLPDIFKVGNTGQHTTKGSQVLSHPLFYRDHQIMLIDLEGLGGTETADVVRAVVQDNLISALLTVASVPCILITNTIQSMKFVEKTVAQIAKLSINFGFLIERIYLLFHDKHLRESEDVRDNQDLLKLVHQLNSRHFEGRSVLKILNKPNFVAVDADLQRQLFLKNLMDDSLYVKKNVTETHVTIEELLAKINLIATHETTDLSQLQLSPLELRLKEEFLTMKKREIQAIQYMTKSLDNCHLLRYFNEAIGKFMRITVAELDNKSTAFKKHCRMQIEFELNLVQAEMIGVEACYSFIRVIPAPAMKKNIKKLVTYLYKTAWCLVDFLQAVKALKGKLKLVKCYFPESRDQIDPLVKAMTTRRNWYIALSSSIYAAQVVLTVATIGVGAAIGAGMRAVRAGVTAAEGAAIVSGRVAVGAAVGLGVGLGGNALGMAGGLCTSMVLTRKATELVWINSAWGNGTVNEGAFEGEELKASVLLLLGSKSTLVSEFANSYVRYIAPFTPATFQAFSPNKYVQMLAFDYYHPGHSLTRGYLICLRMKKKPTSQYYHVMMKIAEVLTPAASVACVLVDNPTSYAQSLLDTLYPPPPSQSLPQATEIKTKVVLLHRSGVNTEHMRRCAGNFELKQMTEFRKDSLGVMIEAVKQELDQAEVQNYSVLRGKVSSLSVALQQFSFKT